MTEVPDTGTLEGLLPLATAADPLVRMNLRDPIAAHGDDAIEAMTDWLADPRLAAFAIRVLGRIGRTEANRAAVIASPRAVDREDLPAHLVRDIDAELASLGAKAAVRPARTAGGRTEHPTGLSGVEGRGYWVMRTSPGRRPFIWAEAQRGRLRQGWGWDDAQNLEVIAEAVRLGRELDEEQRLAWRSRRMRAVEPDGVQLGDLIVAPNLPEWGFLSVFRVTGRYSWDPVDMGIEDKFGHLLPVGLLAERVDRRAPAVSEALRAMTRLPSRLYTIREYGGDVEEVVRRAGLPAGRNESPVGGTLQRPAGDAAGSTRSVDALPTHDSSER